MITAAHAIGDDTAIVSAGSGIPIPPPSYIDAVDLKYLTPNGFGDYATQPIYMPEGLYPLTGVKSLPLDTSMAQGLTIMNNDILQHTADGNNTVFFGWSQSATISTLEMDQLASLPADDRPPTDQLSFMLIGDPSNPDGGFLERFVGGSIPALGVTASGATPDDLYPNTIYTLEYDGYADFPRYPINLLSDLNAVAGIAYVHTIYPNLPASDITSAIELPTEGDTLTHYYMIPVDHLPLLAPLRDFPVIGTPLADLVEPDLRVLVNLGYDNPDNLGWDAGPANVPTQFGLFPNLDQIAKAASELIPAAEAGIKAFAHDLGSLSLPDPTTLLATAPSPADLPTLAEIVNTLSSVAATDYATLLPTADIALSLVTSLPAYDATLVVDALQAGNLLDAIGDPIAADVGLGAVAAGFEILVLVSAIDTTVSELGSLFP